MILLAWVFVLVAIALATRSIEGSWLAPGSYFSLIWLVAAVPAAFVPGLVASAAVFPFICSFMVFAGIGSTLGRATANAVGFARDERADVVRSHARGSSGLTWLVGGLSLFGWYAAYAYVSAAGMTSANFNDSATWIRMAGEYSAARYEGQETETLLVRILTGFNYCAALLSGLNARLTERTAGRLVSLSPVFAAALVTIITTAKAPALLCVIFYVSGRLAYRVWRGAGQQALRSRIAGAVVGAGVVFTLVVTSLALRYGDEGFSSADLLLEKGSSYVFGHMAALSAWISFDGVAAGRLAWGQFTFSGAFEMLNLGQRQQGLYGEIGLNEFSTESNVYSAFRGLVADFSLPGAWVATFFVASVAGYSYERVRRRECGTVAIGLLVVYYSAIAWSPIVSLFIYNSILMAIVVAFVLLRFLSNRILADLRKIDVHRYERGIEVR